MAAPSASTSLPTTPACAGSAIPAPGNTAATSFSRANSTAHTSTTTTATLSSPSSSVDTQYSAAAAGGGSSSGVVGSVGPAAESTANKRKAPADVCGEYFSSAEPLKVLRVRAAARYMQGRRPQQEDRHVLLHDAITLVQGADYAAFQELQCHPTAVIALFDGHCGSVCSDYCATILPERAVCYLVKPLPKSKSKQLAAATAAVVASHEKSTSLLSSSSISPTSSSSSSSAACSPGLSVSGAAQISPSPSSAPSPTTSTSRGVSGGVSVVGHSQSLNATAAPASPSSSSASSTSNNSSSSSVSSEKSRTAHAIEAIESTAPALSSVSPDVAAGRVLSSAALTATTAAAATAPSKMFPLLVKLPVTPPGPVPDFPGMSKALQQLFPSIGARLASAFRHTDRDFLCKYRAMKVGGCTAVLLLVLGSVALVASVGDSRAVAGVLKRKKKFRDIKRRRTAASANPSSFASKEDASLSSTRDDAGNCLSATAAGDTAASTTAATGGTTAATGGTTAATDAMAAGAMGAGAIGAGGEEGVSCASGVVGDAGGSVMIATTRVGPEGEKHAYVKEGSSGDTRVGGEGVAPGHAIFTKKEAWRSRDIPGGSLLSGQRGGGDAATSSSSAATTTTSLAKNKKPAGGVEGSLRSDGKYAEKKEIVGEEGRYRSTSGLTSRDSEGTREAGDLISRDDSKPRIEAYGGDMDVHDAPGVRDRETKAAPATQRGPATSSITTTTVTGTPAEGGRREDVKGRREKTNSHEENEEEDEDTDNDTAGGHHRWMALRVTRDHKPDDPEEKERIEKNGGLVLRVGSVARVAPKDYEERAKRHKREQCLHGSATQPPPVLLAVSRGMGDRELKEERLLTATPDVTALSLTGEIRVLVVACDGVWDVLTDEEVVGIASQHLDDPQEAASQVVKRAFQLGSQDNLTSIVVVFDYEGDEQ